MSGRLPTYFLTHGGGPWNYVKGPLRDVHSQLETSLRSLPEDVGEKPKAILVLSAHWEAPNFTVMTSPKPPMLYDYGGFPPETYQVKYAAPGSPDLAAHVKKLLEKTGKIVDEDPQRGFDHGAFVPLAVAYPKADIPVVQLAMRSDYDPEQHLAAGRALAPLRDEGVLILASGSSYHNLRQFGDRAEALAKIEGDTFDQWLTQTLCYTRDDERSLALRHWDEAPSAKYAHPREDHLVPLFVAVGAAESEVGRQVYHEVFAGKHALSSYRFG